MQLVVDSLLVHCERRGDGPTVLLIHGWGDQGDSLAGLGKLLAKHYEVISLDLPGFRKSEAPPVVWGLDEYAQFLGTFMGKISARPYAIIGHSNGGSIAIRGLARHTISAEKLILLDSAGIRDRNKGRKRAIIAATKVGKVLTSPLPDRFKQRIRRSVYSQAGSDMLVVEHLHETFKRVVSDDVQADAGILALPTLLIYGADDRDTPAEYGRIFHKLIHFSTLEVIPEAGHFVHLDQPDQVDQLIEKFLA